ncbi:unnamed protein product [Pleuronectes platessa]|uniref:non-specific serine/threonine protein kinase n=1 Tax=Pleuronectes platessa TaxID=8262 RepID=A0A9N7YTA9_PLEPL|nr:unnamed protein product [Pleuronectes platessa]
MFGTQVSPIAILANSQSVTKARKRKATTESKPQRKRGRKVPDACTDSGHISTDMVGTPVSPIAILASYQSVTKARKRKATTENKPQRKRGRKVPDACTCSGHTSTERIVPTQSPSPILASNRPVIKAKRRITKQKGTTENEPPLQKQRGGEGPDASTNSDLSTLESAPKVNSSTDKSTVLSGHTSRANFEAKYVELEQLGKGGFGTVFAGIRRSDDLLVAIKHIPKSSVPRQRVMINGRSRLIPKEVLLMHKAAGEPVTVGRSAAVSLLDWYDLKQEVLLVMERPVDSTDLLQLIKKNCGPLAENHAQIIMKQLLDAAIDLKAKGIFHRDLKLENILIEPSSDGPRVRIIDFGCGSNRRENCVYSQFTGTFAYAPPEFTMKGRYMAGPTTVWQLAAILFEMLSGDACPNSPIPNLTVSMSSIPNSPISNFPIPNFTISSPNSPILNSPISNFPIPNLTISMSSIPNSPISNFPILNFTISSPNSPILISPISNLIKSKPSSPKYVRYFLIVFLSESMSQPE